MKLEIAARESRAPRGYEHSIGLESWHECTLDVSTEREPRGLMYWDERALVKFCSSRDRPVIRDVHYIKSERLRNPYCLLSLKVVRMTLGS